MLVIGSTGEVPRGVLELQAVASINSLHRQLMTFYLRDKQQRYLLLFVEYFAGSLSNALRELRVADECLGGKPSGAKHRARKQCVASDGSPSQEAAEQSHVFG